MTDTLLPTAPQPLEKERDGYFRKGCNPLAQTGRSKLQNQRAALNQQILKTVRMRTGAENLLKAATNHKVREQVRLELSFVNSDLQMLKEQLKGLNISVGVYQSTEEAFTISLIPLGLKETKEVDFSVVLKDFILEHYSEDSYLYEDEIADFMDLRQACRTPSRDEAGVELLMSYFIQLGFMESRFFPPTRQMGILFMWYDSLTGVPVSQQNLLLETYSWARLACVKAHHYGALAHYFAATLLINHKLKPGADEDHQEKCLAQLYDHMPEGLTPLATLKNRAQRIDLGKSHLHSAISQHEESVREASLCTKLRNIEVLQEVLCAALQRSRLKYAQHQDEDDLLNLLDAPDIVSKTEKEVEIIPPQFSKMTVTDFFQKLGPLSVFSASKRWTPPRSIHFIAEEGDLGFTLRGNSPVQVHFLDPYCSAALAGAKEGDYIVAVQDVDCKWLTVSEVMKLLKDSGEEDIEMKVVSLLDSTSSMHSKCVTYSVGMQKTYSMICLAIDDDEKTDKTKKVSKKLSFLSWGTNKNRQKFASTMCLPAVGVAVPHIKKKLPSPFSLLNTDSSLY
ncbi:PREDICTED: rhophilin-2-like [Elephantulus edwardii]|uniref:rhophilin-2-like n=1 Tax=Elephantulus edwardii TaxID=28737 RepID=UPI0003F07276|nr:PREDICTED: rhophilin-2-like [Elephantulus edwardii]